MPIRYRFLLSIIHIFGVFMVHESWSHEFSFFLSLISHGIKKDSCCINMWLIYTNFYFFVKIWWTITMLNKKWRGLLFTDHFFAVRDLDINQVPSIGAEEDWITMNIDDEEESSNGGPPRKKLRLTKEQSRLLEESFRQNHTLNPVNLSLFSFLLVNTKIKWRGAIYKSFENLFHPTELFVVSFKSCGPHTIVRKRRYIHISDR